MPKPHPATGPAASAAYAAAVDHSARVVPRRRPFAPGVRVAYTGAHLRNSGQRRGSATLDRFIVQPCECRGCRSGERVAVNELACWCDPEDPAFDAAYAAELTREVGNTWRHISTEALCVVGELDHRNSP